MLKKMSGLLALGLATLALTAWATPKGHYKYGIWSPSVVYSQSGSSTRLEGYVKRGIKEVNFEIYAKHYVYHDDGLNGDKAAGDNVFTVEGVVYSDTTRSPAWISTYGASLNLVLSDCAVFIQDIGGKIFPGFPVIRKSDRPLLPSKERIMPALSLTFSKEASFSHAYPLPGKGRWLQKNSRWSLLFLRFQNFTAGMM